MNRGCWPTGVEGGTKPDQTAVVSWLAGVDARAMKSSAPWAFLEALDTAYAHPPRVDAAPGAWPFSVGNGADPTSVFAAAHGAAEFEAAQTVGYQLDPMAIASLPCFISSGGWPTASERNNWDVGAPRPIWSIFW